VVGDIARALVGVAQLGIVPAVFAILARSKQGCSLKPDIFTGGDV